MHNLSVFFQCYMQDISDEIMGNPNNGSKKQNMMLDQLSQDVFVACKCHHARNGVNACRWPSTSFTPEVRINNGFNIQRNPKEISLFKLIAKYILQVVMSTNMIDTNRQHMTKIPVICCTVHTRSTPTQVCYINKEHMHVRNVYRIMNMCIIHALRFSTTFSRAQR